MTDAELLRGYRNAESKCVFMLRAAERENTTLAEIAARLTRLGKLPGRSLQRVFGTTRAEIIPEAVIREYARRNQITMRQGRQQGVITDYCEGCIYLIDNYGKTCGYITIEHKRRGCPAGDGCTKRMHIRRKK